MRDVFEFYPVFCFQSMYTYVMSLPSSLSLSLSLSFSPTLSLSLFRSSSISCYPYFASAGGGGGGGEPLPPSPPLPLLPLLPPPTSFSPKGPVVRRGGGQPLGPVSCGLVWPCLSAFVWHSFAAFVLFRRLCSPRRFLFRCRCVYGFHFVLSGAETD